VTIDGIIASGNAEVKASANGGMMRDTATVIGEDAKVNGEIINARVIARDNASIIFS